MRLFILYLNKEGRTLDCTLRSKVRDIVQEGILELPENTKLSICQEKPVVFAIFGPMQFSKVYFVSSVSLGTSNKNPQQRLRGVGVVEDSYVCICASAVWMTTLLSLVLG